MTNQTAFLTQASEDRTGGRISVRVPAHVYDVLNKAAQLMGSSLNSYAIQVLLPHAQEVIDAHNMRSITLNEVDSTWFLSKLETSSVSNEKLTRGLSNLKRLKSNDCINGSSN